MWRNAWIAKRIRVPLLISLVLLAGGGELSGCASPTDTLKLGCITPLTGDGATYGAATQRAVDLAVEEINAGGGIGGKKLEVVYEDDQMNATTAATALQKLIAVDHVPLVLGAFGSSMTLAIAPIAERSHVVLFTASSTADSIQDAGDYIFRNVPPNRGQGRTAARFVLGALKARKACVLRMNNDYGVSLTAAFTEAFTQGGGQILSEDSYEPGATDFRTALSKIRASAPEVTFIPGHYQESGLLLKQARELGLACRFVGGDGSYSPDLITLAGEAAEGTYYTLMALGDPASNDALAHFVAAFKAKYGNAPDVYAAYAYDATKLLAQAIKNGGYNADGIKQALYADAGFAGITGVTKFDARGEVDKPFAVYVVKGGKFEDTKWDGN